MEMKTNMTAAEAERVLADVPDWLSHECDIQEDLYLVKTNLDQACDRGREDNERLHREALVSAVAAQTHATMHLAEQQRIANLLELCRMVKPANPLEPLRNAEVLLGFVEEVASPLFDKDLAVMLRLDRRRFELRAAALEALSRETGVHDVDLGDEDEAA